VVQDRRCNYRSKCGRDLIAQIGLYGVPLSWFKLIDSNFLAVTALADGKVGGSPDSSHDLRASLARVFCSAPSNVASVLQKFERAYSISSCDLVKSKVF
jgi:hypothetical protein